MKCKICGREFKARHGNQRFCSCECRDESLRRSYRASNAKHKASRLHKVKCQKCGVEFETTSGRKKYCSEDCATAAKQEQNRASNRRHHRKTYEPKPKRLVKCENCGKEFETNRDNQRYCSSECYAEQHRRECATKWKQNAPVYKKKCLLCGCEFEATDSRRKYCSKECRNKARAEQRRKESPPPTNEWTPRSYTVVRPKKEPSPPIMRKCEYCGKEFEVKGWHPAQKYCNRVCYEAGRHQEPLPTEPEPPKKSMSEIAREAAECNLDYGTYRAFLNMGKTYEELKAQADRRNPQVHNGLGRKRLPASATVNWARLIG